MLFNDSDELLEYLLKLSFTKNYIYRGVKQDIEKLPKIMRYRTSRGLRDLTAFETDILEKFMRYGCSLVDGLLNPIDIVGYAQHFGLPTRLIDWTYNPFIALFFSINGLYSDDYAEDYQVYKMEINKQLILRRMITQRDFSDIEISESQSGINNYIRFLDIIKDNESLFDIFKFYYVYIRNMDKDRFNKTIGAEIYRKINENRFIVMDMDYSNPRIITQQGLFVLPKKLDISQINDEYEKSEIEVISVSKSIKNDLLKKLDSMGINRKRLFFDLASICNDIVEETILVNDVLDNWYK